MNAKMDIKMDIKKLLGRWQIQALIVLFICFITITYLTNNANKCDGYYSVGKCIKIKYGRHLKKNYVIEYKDYSSNSFKRFEQINSSFKTNKNQILNNYFLIKICENKKIAFIDESLDSINFGKKVNSKRRITFMETLGFW